MLLLFPPHRRPSQIYRYALRTPFAIRSVRTARRTLNACAAARASTRAAGHLIRSTDTRSSTRTRSSRYQMELIPVQTTVNISIPSRTMASSDKVSSEFRIRNKIITVCV